MNVLTSSSPASGSCSPGGRPTQRMTPHSGGFSLTSTIDPTSNPGWPCGGDGALWRGVAAGGRSSGCSPITEPAERERGPWLMLPLGPTFRLKLKGREWNLLSLDSEVVVGGARDGDELGLKSGGVSVRDLAGSSPTVKKQGHRNERLHWNVMMTRWCISVEDQELIIQSEFIWDNHSYCYELIINSLNGVLN